MSTLAAIFVSSGADNSFFLAPNHYPSAKKSNMMVKHGTLSIYPPTWVAEDAYPACFNCYELFASVGKPHHCAFCFAGFVH